MAAGGVGRNIAENLARLGTAPTSSAPSARRAGGQLLDHTRAPACASSMYARSAQPTGTYTAVLDADGELVVADRRHGGHRRARRPSRSRPRAT